MDVRKFQIVEAPPAGPNPLPPPPKPDGDAFHKWPKIGGIDKQDFFILVASGLVLLIAIVLGSLAITADLFH